MHRLAPDRRICEIKLSSDLRIQPPHKVIKTSSIPSIWFWILSFIVLHHSVKPVRKYQFLKKDLVNKKQIFTFCALKTTETINWLISSSIEKQNRNEHPAVVSRRHKLTIETINLCTEVKNQVGSFLISSHTIRLLFETSAGLRRFTLRTVFFFFLYVPVTLISSGWQIIIKLELCFRKRTFFFILWQGLRVCQEKRRSRRRSCLKRELQNIQ